MAKEPFAAQLTSLWIGGFFFWIIKGFKGKLKDQFILQFKTRNIWSGYIIELLVTGIVLYFIIKNS